MASVFCSGGALPFFLFGRAKMNIAPSHSIRRNIANPFFPHFTRLSRSKKRDEVSKSTLGEGGYVMELYYDDYMPVMVMENNYNSDSSPWRQSTGAAYYGHDVPPEQQQQQQQMQQNYDENKTGWSP